jgi:hypothetical protein
MSVESQNFEASKDGRYYGTALKIRPLLGNGSVAVTLSPQQTQTKME